MTVITVSLIFGAVITIYFYITRNYKYWQKRGVPCADGTLPGIGHMWMLFTNTASTCYRKIYNDNKKHSMIGIYNFTSPSLMILEPELVKTVLQSNFANFHDNSFKLDPKIDPLLALNPFFLSHGEKWALVRKRFTYAFSSMRLKTLLESIKPVCVSLEDFLDKKLKRCQMVAELELKDLFSRFTAQVVAIAGLGIDGLCFDEENESTSLRNVGKIIMEPSVRNQIMNTITFFVPPLNNLLKMRFMPKQTDRFFRNLVTELVQQRRTDEAKSRSDFLQLMIELERIEGNKFDMETFVSHAFTFFLDGYETSSIVLSFAAFHLAIHPQAQDRLRDEVLSVLDKYDGVITYEALKEMTYMDQVLNESQRLRAVGGFMTKTCTKEFELKGSDGLTCRVQPGTNIVISIEGLHKDPRYWENSDVFDPDRFSPDRKQNIQKFTFLPFGEGPRICVGMRMALLQMKACLATILKKYSLQLSSRTQLPLKMVSGIVLSSVKGGLWVNFRKI